MLKNLDKKKSIELVITGAGIVFLIFLLNNNINNSRKKTQRDSNIKTAAGQLLLGDSVVTQKTATEENSGGGFDSDVSWGKDPFLPGSTFSNSSPGGLILNGIVWDEKNPYAILNDDIVKAGDRINGVSVVEIKENSITIEQDGDRYTLELKTF